MSDIEIRVAATGDLENLQQLSNKLGEIGLISDSEAGQGWASSSEGRQYYHNHLKRQDGICFIALCNNQMIGFLSGSLKPTNTWITVLKAEVDNLYIEEDFRSKGIGKDLLQAFKVWAQSKGVKRLSVNVFFKNERAIKFYQREGFSPYDITLELQL